MESHITRVAAADRWRSAISVPYCVEWNCWRLYLR